MVAKCCVFGCDEKSVKGGGGPVSFHVFPRDETRRKIWSANIQRENFVVSNHTKICSKHFTPESFDRNKTGGSWLKKDAEPTLFNFPERLIKKETAKRKDRNEEFPQQNDASLIHRKKRKVFLGDFDDNDMNSPTEARRALFIAKIQHKRSATKIHNLKKSNMKLKKNVSFLRQVIADLRKKSLISKAASNVLEMEVITAPIENVSPPAVLNALPDESSKMETQDKNDEPDLYSYTKLNDFTSEIYKIELCNMPKFVGFKQLRKFLNGTMDLKTRKVKAIGNPPTFAFITFENEDERNNALKKLNGYVWKGKSLVAKLAAPAADPMARKRREGNSEDCPAAKRQAKEDDIPVEIRLKNAVTPFWNVPYEEQLQRKQDDIHKFLMKLSKGIEKVNRGLMNILSQERKKHYFQCCVLNEIKPSPVTTGYRNKCEFTCGRHLHTKDKTVGFRLNSYKEGSMSVAEPDDCINIGEPMLKAVKSFQSYIRQSDLDVYNPENHAGYWRQLTVRTSNNSDVLLIVVIHPQSLTTEELQEEKSKLKNYFEEGAGSSVGVTSVYVQLFSKKSFHEDEIPFTHLMGKKFLEESLLGLKFQVSPESFFQINIPAAEILYTLVADLVSLTPNATVLDVCCGTGTISLCLAKAGLNVIGIEMCPEAVENARQNARQANISNVEFVCGKAEDVIIPTLNKIKSSEIIAVVDPPRAGLHQKVLKAIRAAKPISQLVYVSCNPTIAFNNFVDLCRTPSNNYRGSAFYPVRADVVDMFPYTPHKELVLLFKRSTDIVLDPKDNNRAAENVSEGTAKVRDAKDNNRAAEVLEATLKVEVKCDEDKTENVAEQTVAESQDGIATKTESVVDEEMDRKNEISSEAGT